MVDVAPSHHGDGLEAAMGVLGEAGDDVAVVHAPATQIGEVGADLTPMERFGRSQGVVSFGIVVDVMDGEDERVQSVPGKTELHYFQHWFR